MLGNLEPQAADKILMLIGQYKADPRKDKIDLGVGVYKNADGVTPVMRAVKAAEKQLWEVETTKTYTGLAGEPEYQRRDGRTRPWRCRQRRPHLLGRDTRAAPAPAGRPSS